MFCKPICLFAALLGLVAGDFSATKPAVADDAKTAVKKAGEVKPLHVGVWKARFSNGEKILKFNPDGTFLLLTHLKGQDEAYRGRYRIEAGVLTYEIPGLKATDASVSFLGGNLMHLRGFKADKTLDGGVVFERQKDVSNEKLELAGTFKTRFAKDSTFILQLDSDGTYKSIQLLPGGQQVATGRWEMRAGKLVLKLGKKDHIYEVVRIEADSIHLRKVTKKNDDRGFYMHNSKV